MKQHILFLIASLFVLNSFCSRRTTRAAGNETEDQQSAMSFGDAVNELGHNIMAIYHVSRNSYWFGSWESGLLRYDGKTIVHFTTIHGLPHNRVEDIQEDSAGNIYINTSDGLCKFDGQRFTTLIERDGDEWKLQDGDMWFKSLKTWKI